MKYKKSISVVIYMLAIMILLSGCGGESIKSCVFQSEEEMSEVLNGIWRTGDTEFDFILSIENGKANLSMEGKEDVAEDIVYVPDKGYFYYFYNNSEGNEAKIQFSIVNENGEYVIKDDY